MDRSNDFLIVCRELTSTDIDMTFGSRSPSPFLLKSSDMLGQLTKFHKLMQSIFDNYVGYNRFLPDSVGKMKIFSVADRIEFNKETLVFITSMATEIKHLNRMLDSNNDLNHQSCMSQHNKEIVSFLLQKLGVFTNLSELMQRKQKSINVSPFRLLSGTYDSSGFNSLAAPPPAGTDNQPTTRSFFGNIINSTLSNADSITSSSGTNNSLMETDNSFAQRYVDEIAPPSKMAVYRSVAATHKQSLLQEARILQVRFSDDLNESQQMEREVGRISQLLTQFASLVAGQSEVVGDIHGAAKQATRSVTDAGEQLQLTITRSQSSQWYMVILVLGLSILVLLLDGLTP